ncbi:hypothetical protein DUF2235 [Octadecabacter arcticus 238]|uniref:T6SS Phospholipase effector Tle1-like catalytic domain-containing protein n=1 Tax=Octadecabacter arcticus 238 TaxID=391616 RepID=M9REW9_9RHOB|nr:DUF2235 domain-containing protein [Octadecabacter arcticus]AGI71159.1 hypothetical protein DUF2235 [Octadecabacter arcticus 238]
MRLLNWVQSLIRRSRTHETAGVRHRGSATHVVILDGTMSSLEVGCETHAGQLYKLLQEASGGTKRAANLTIYYEPGIQWTDWGETLDVMLGRGINSQIKRAYGVLASRYRSGDRIVLAGYSRGAYAVRSLVGVIDLVGLVRTDCATERNVQLAYRHYRRGGRGLAAEAFRKRMCHATVTIEAVAVWDTVKALGVRLPILWRWSVVEHAFHNHALGASVRHGFHALALDETREAYAPVLWACPPGWSGKMEQVWFAGTHGDVGGQINGYEPARPLANLSLVWMLEQLERCKIPLPDGWAARFPTDATAPSVGLWRGWAKLFWSRKARVVGRDASERPHPSVAKNRPDDPKVALRN